MSEEPKMKEYDNILKTVQKTRLEQMVLEEQQEKVTSLIDTLREYGINCNNVTNCVDVGVKCFKCKNNYSRRSYFRDLLAKGADVGIYSASATMFDEAGVE